MRGIYVRVPFYYFKWNMSHTTTEHEKRTEKWPRSKNWKIKKNRWKSVPMLDWCIQYRKQLNNWFILSAFSSFFDIHFISLVGCLSFYSENFASVYSLDPIFSFEALTILLFLSNRTHLTVIIFNDFNFPIFLFFLLSCFIVIVICDNIRFIMLNACVWTTWGVFGYKNVFSI